MDNDYEQGSAQVIEDFHVLLQQLPNARVEAPQFQGPSSKDWGGDSGFDAQIKLSVAGKPLILFIEAKKSVFPRDVRQTLWEVKRWVSEVSHGESQVVPVIAAESISAGAKDLLRSEHVGYYDTRKPLLTSRWRLRLS